MTTNGEKFEANGAQLSVDLVEQLEIAQATAKWRTLQAQTRHTLEFLSDIKSKVEGVDSFWLQVLSGNTLVASLFTAVSDQHALSFLKDIELKQDIQDPRPFELVFHFKENPYFSNSTLTKKYKLKPEYARASDDGSVTKEMTEFVFEHLQPSAETIQWKEGHDLIAKYPRNKVEVQEGEDEEVDFEGDAGSFFYFFTEETDGFGIGEALIEQVLPQAVDFFLGKIDDGELEGEDDELDEEDEEDPDEIDLEEEEENPKKKRKTQ